LLGIPVYGAHPGFAHWGTKTGSREAFEASGVPVVPGVHGIRTRPDVSAAIEHLRAADPGLARVIVKIDDGASGVGNGTIDLRDRPDIVDPLDTIMLEDKDFTATAYYERLEEIGGVVEAFLVAEEVRSPSVQLRLSPDGEVEVTSTHEQVLGGPNGLTYLGCTMPAESGYAVQIGRLAQQVGKFLADKGVVGRCGIDFLAARTGSTWTAYGSEINLRNGGTTHPLATLSSLTAGGYDMEDATYRAADGRPKFYRATDHLQGENYGALTTDDLLDVLERHELGWDHDAASGTVFHMASAIGGNGVVGLTAIGDSPAAADEQFKLSRAALDREAGRLGRS
jgi:hypothetical protein